MRGQEAPVVVPAEGESAAAMVSRTLSSLRETLSMEYAFLGEFVEGRRVYRFVDAAPEAPQRIVAGDSDPLEESYCAHVVSGDLPQVIADASRVPFASRFAATTAFPVGAHLSVPVLRDDGSPWGTLCCFSSVPDGSVRDRDANVLSIFARMLAPSLERLSRERLERDTVVGLVHRVLAADGPDMVLQPIIDLRSGATWGHEALARFPQGPDWTPDRWFARAATVGLGADLELAALRNAVGFADLLPDRTKLTLNVSPAVLSTRAVRDLLCTAPDPSRLVVELTEHERVAAYGDLRSALRELRSAGVLLAVDDAGTGYAGLEHILELAPDVLKLDRALVVGSSSDPAKQAMARALTYFAVETGASLIAEGIEARADCETLRVLGVQLGQGWHLGRPRPAREAF